MDVLWAELERTTLSGAPEELVIAFNNQNWQMDKMNVCIFFLSSNIYRPPECFLYDLNASELTAEIHFPATLQGQCTIIPKYNYQHCVEIWEHAMRIG